ncbi:MAG TPA: hypothetical protein VF658_00600 [Pyrinomonadaceae bacterium]|jgi:hypothetical protein
MKRIFVSLIVLAIAAFLPLSAFGQKGNVKAEVRKADRQDTSRPLREIAPLKAGKREYENPMNFVKKGAQTGQTDPVVQSAADPLVAVVNGLNFEGVGDGLPSFNVTVAPPDTTGDVGATQYVQWVNLSFAVFDKTSGAIVYGPAAGNTLWAGFGGPCETRNDGDPIVQYDQLAGRWIMTQFALPSGGPYTQCVAVSQTSDATGAYNRYSFSYGTAVNDYPHMGVWPDGYYITYNMFGNNGSAFSGSRVCAFDRAKMLAGQPATQQCFQLSTAYGSTLPADLDGSTLPPAGAPNYVINDGTNALNFWKFHVDWTTPANTTFTGPVSVPVAAFSHPCPTTNRGACVPQPSTQQKLESLADRLMYRFAYRNFGTHESLVVNQAVSVGSGRKGIHTGIRWYELRNPGAASPTVYQQGTYSPDANWRWMGSAAMDKQGNLAIGYSVSSGMVRPSIRFAARSATDPLNTLGAEVNLFTGTGSQTNTLARWGDYATLSVDPVDDCTMWFTTEYLATNGTWNWHTRIASFKLGTCQ